MRPLSDLPPDATVQPCPYAVPPHAAHWLEIQLVGEDDQGISFEEYEVVLPDGQVTRGYLDVDGYARLEGIERAGTCKVRFPALDKDAWERLASVERRTDGAAVTQN